MPAPTVTVNRPPSQLAKLDKKLTRAIPAGLPPAVKKFYAAGDGLEVTVNGEQTATIVGLADMFDRSFKPHKPTSKLLSSTTGRPFADRFFDDDFEGDVEQLNVLLRLKLLASLPGESVDIAIDMFAGKTPVLYMISDLTPFRLSVSFDAFVDYFSKYGAARWYYAFLPPEADVRMNVDVAAELAASMKPFGKDASLQKVLAARAKAVAKLGKDRQKREKAEAKATASPSRKATRDELDEIKSAAATAKTELAWSTSEGLAAAIASGQVPPATAWNFIDGLRVLPKPVLPQVLAARRIKEQDALLWRRVDQLVDVAIPAGTKLDPVLADACAVIARARGEDVPFPARYEGVLAELGTFSRLVAQKEDTADRREIARLRRERLRAVGAALVGEPRYLELLRDSFRRGTGPKFEALLLIAPEISLDDLGRIADHLSVGALAELAATNKWSRAALQAQAKKQPTAARAIGHALELL